MEEIFKILGDVNRLRILNLLMKNELCVCEIEVILDITQSNASRHLNKLKLGDFLNSSKDSLWTHYTVNLEFVKKHKSLFEYLESNFNNNEKFLKDLNRYYKYKENNLSCKNITENKLSVLEIIK